MKKLIAAFFISVTIFLFALYYVFLVVPNDRRIKLVIPQAPAVGVYDELYFDMTKNISSAKINMPELTKAGKLLDKYPFKQDFPGLHNGPLNLHLSLGWFPLKTVHRDCIFAPAPSELEYSLTLPLEPVLKFDYGIISSIDGFIQGGARFTVALKGVNGQETTVFDAVEKPLQRYGWRYYDFLYKNLIKYIWPGIEDRDGRWNPAEVDLKEYANSKVTIILRVMPTKGSALSFWGRPCVYSRAASASKRPPSVILVVIDSFKHDHMIPEYCPELCAMASEGVDFKRALSNGNNTKLSVYSFMASRYPFEMPETATHYDLSRQEKESFYNRQIMTIPRMFGENGYRTAGIGSVSLFSDGHGLSGDIGFDEIENLETSGYSPPHVTQEALNWLSRHGSEKFFLLVYYYGPHGPYRPPLRYLWKALKPGKYANPRDALYSGDIIYHDDYLKILKDYVKSNPALKDTVVVVTADHGIAFRSGVYDWPTRFGAWKKKKESFHSHGVNVTPDDLNVPFVFWNLGKRKVIERKVQLLDLAPTLAEIANIKPSKDFKGQSLLGLIDGKDFSEGVTFHQGVTNRGVYWKDEYLYVNNFMPREGFPKETVVPEEMYNIVSDSACANNLAFVESPELTKMRKIFESVLASEEENRIVNFERSGRPVNLDISIDGAVGTVNPASAVKASTKRSFTAELSPGDTLSFTTVPSKAAIRISGQFSDGYAVNSSGILYGSSGIALNNTMTITSEDRDYYRGLPDKFMYQDAATFILFGTFIKDKASTEDLKNAPKQLKSMLEQWGYIN